MYGDIDFFDKTTFCFYNLIQALLKKEHPNFVAATLPKTLLFSRDMYNYYSKKTGVGSRAIGNPPQKAKIAED
jgi:hypothetical protein